MNETLVIDGFERARGEDSRLHCVIFPSCFSPVPLQDTPELEPHTFWRRCLPDVIFHLRRFLCGTEGVRRHIPITYANHHRPVPALPEKRVLEDTTTIGVPTMIPTGCKEKNSDPSLSDDIS